MGKHDKTIVESSEEYLNNRIKDLEKRLAFAGENNAKLIKENAKWQKWFNEHDAAAQDVIAEKDAEIELLNAKIAKLVKLYV